jgi:hypothetical protein
MDVPAGPFFKTALRRVIVWGALDGLTLGQIGAAPFGVQ